MCLIVVLQHISGLHYIVWLFKKNGKFFPFPEKFWKMQLQPCCADPTIYVPGLSGKLLSIIPGYQASSYPLYQVIRQALIQYTRLSGKLLSIIHVPGYQESPYPIYQIIRQALIHHTGTRLSGRPLSNIPGYQANLYLWYQVIRQAIAPSYHLSGKPLSIISVIR